MHETNATLQADEGSADSSPWRLPATAPWIALVATLLLVAFLEVRRTPPEVVAVDAPAEVFSAERAHAVLETILGDGARGGASDPNSHPTGTDAAEQVRGRIADQLVAAGLSRTAISVQETVACRDSGRWSYVGCAPVKNLVARLPGPSEGPAVVLMSHYDSVGAGPGVSDDAVGVAATVEAVRALLADDPRGERRRHPVVVLVTDAEEVGLFGARGFVDRHPLAQKAEGIGAVINLEARGTRGQSLLFQASADDAWLVDVYRSFAERPATSSLYAEVYRRLPNDTDLTVFLDAGVVGVNFAYAEGVQRYHTPRDDMAHLDRRSLQHHGDHLLGMTRVLSSDPRLADPPEGRAVYADFASLFVLSYPLAWALPLAALALAALLGLAWVEWRHGGLRVPELLMALLGLLVSTALAVFAVAEFGDLVRRLTGDSRPGWAHPLPFRAAVWSLVFLVVACVQLALRRLGSPTARFASARLRTSGGAVAWGSWILLGVLAVLLAAVAPGVSLFAALPAWVAVALGALAAFRPSSRLRLLALMGVALATSFFWLNIARGLEMGIGLHAETLLAVPLAIASWPYAALFWTPSRRSRRLAAATLAAVFVAGLGGALWVAPYDFAHPQDVNVIHFEDHGDSPFEKSALEKSPFEKSALETTIWVDSGADRPPAEMVAAAGGLSPERESTPDGLRIGSAYRVLGADTPEASAPTPSLPVPRLEILRSEATATGRDVTFRMIGPAADFLRLELPGDVDLRRVRVAGYDVDLAGKEPPRGQHVLACTGPACDEIEFRLEFGSSPDDSVSGSLFAIRYGSVHGLPEPSRRVADARPDWATPVHSGDRTAVRVGVSLR